MAHAVEFKLKNPQRVLIRYQDAGGTMTDRIILPLELAGELRDANQLHVHMMRAWCELTRDLRHFRLDRFEAISDAVTGNTLSDDEWSALMQAMGSELVWVEHDAPWMGWSNEAEDDE